MEHKCLRCGWKWMSRVRNPKACPRCKRYDWNVPPKIKKNKKKGGE